MDAASPQPAESASSSTRLLIVDDNAIDQRHYRRLLGADPLQHFDITACTTGGAGLTALRDQRFDCILLDFSLPDMSGLDFLSRIAGPAGDPPCAVVLITGQGSEMVAAEAVRRGIQDYVVKNDLPHAELGRMVARAVERVELRRQLDRSILAAARSNAALAHEVEIRRIAEADAAAARQHAEHANQAKSAFVAQMSHELRTPMNAVIGLTSLLLEEPLTPQQRDYAGEVYAAANGLLRLLNDILDLSKLEAGRVDLEKIDFDLETLLQETMEMAAHKLAGKPVELCVAIDEPLRRRCFGDPTRLRQIVLNYLDNAVKFTASGEIVLSATPIGCPAPGGPLALRLTVTDTGIGIDAGALNRVFMPFTQANHAVTRLYGGSGLGLAIARQMAELMGGKVGATSTPGRGSQFWVELRLEPAQLPVQDAADTAPYAGLRAILVDDCATSRAILRGNLEELGFAVEDYADGPTALAALTPAASRPSAHLLLTDQLMPGMPGEDVIAAFRSNAGASRAKTILLTAPGRTVMAPEVPDAAIAKPVSRAALRHGIRSLLGAQMQPAPAPEADTDPFWRHETVQRRVLLVEDHPVNQKVAAGILRKAGYRVDLASNGASAIARANQRAYDLILMDLQMPDMGGMEAAGRIRAAETAGRVPIVALTAHVMAGARETCLAQGMDDFIGKPIDARSFLGVVRNWIGHQAQAAGGQSSPADHRSAETTPAAAN